MATVKPRVRVPRNVKKGDVIEIKTLISHKMESGRRKGKDGKLIPRKIINRFECRFDGEMVFAADWYPAISANPYMAFNLKAEKSGKLDFKWVDDDGTIYSTSENLKVA